MVRSEADDVQDEEDWPDQIEYDPRWEVQPAMDDEDDSAGNGRFVILALVGLGALVALLAWVAVGTTPAV